MKNEKLGYLSSLDLLRGLAALAVCYFHFTHGNPEFLSKSNVLYVSGRFGFLGVDVFFVISGFVIPYAMYRGSYNLKEFGAFLLIALIMIFVKFDKRYLVAALLPYFFITYFEFNDRVSKFLGNISYSLYLVHIPIGGRIINLCEGHIKDVFIRSVFVFIAFFVSIASAWLFYKFIENPFIGLSKRITYKKT